MNCCRRFPLSRISCRTSRWRSLTGPSFSLCRSSTYPFRSDRGVLRSWAAEASALVVRWKRSRSSLYSWSRFSGLGTSPALAAKPVADSEAVLTSETHVFFWTEAMRNYHRSSREGEPHTISPPQRSEEHTSELQSHSFISY